MNKSVLSYLTFIVNGILGNKLLRVAAFYNFSGFLEESAGVVKYRKRWAWPSRLVSALAVGAIVTFSGNYALAQITPDGTLGSKRSIVKPNVTIKGSPADRIDGGAINGVNLFHSFQEFTVSNGQRVYFSSPEGIENILSRVTGTNLSDIQGMLGIDGRANLFLLNPNGIVFGPNAQLDVSGSFVASTANAIQFGKQGFFSALTPEAPLLLTINPSAFFFNQTAAKSIVNQAGLQVPMGQSLLLLGGDVVIDRGGLSAPDGRVEFGGVAGSGSVGLKVNSNVLDLDFADSIAGADVSLTNGANVNVSGEGGGLIQVQGDRVTFADASAISADTSGNQNGKGIAIQALQFIVRDGAQVSASAIEKSQGNSGGITVNALESVELIGVSSSGQGGGKNGGSGGSQGGGSGDGGKPSKLASDARGAGQAGNLTINTKRLTVQDGARISSSTIDSDGGGNIIVNATESVEVVGSSGERERSSGLSVQTRGAGQAGDLTINTGQLIIQGGGEVSASTFGKGDGGSVNVNATESVEVIGASGDDKLPSRLVAETGRELDTQDEGTLIGTGKGGSLDITTGQLIVQDGAEVSVSGLSEGPERGDAGNLQVTADSIRLDNKAAIKATTTSGNGGNIFLQTQDLLLLRNTSQISTRAGTEETPGAGGSIIIDTENLVALENSDIDANAFDGPGGQISINTQGDFRSPNSDITATSNLGPQFSGTVEINTPDVDPSQGLANLPIEPVNTEIAQDCQAGSGEAASRFSNTGSGGLPTNPYEPLSSGDILADVQPPTQWGSNPLGGAPSSKTKPDSIVEAQGWSINKTGEVVLVSQVPHRLFQRGCRLR